MKRSIFTLITVLVLVLTGCAAPSPAVSAPSSAASVPELSKADVLSAYAQAAEVYDWFDLCAPPTTGDAISVDGYDYYAVNLDDISTYGDLEERVRSLFSPALADEILAGSNIGAVAAFRDIDGKLYTLPGARGVNLYLIGKALRAEQSDETHWTLTLTFYGDSYEFDQPAATVGYSQNTLTYEKTDEGWRFTSFCSSDDFDLDCNTVFNFIYNDAGFAAMDFENASDLELACWLLHADGKFAEVPGDIFIQHLLFEPDDWFASLSVLPDDAWNYALTVASSPINTWFTQEEQIEFQQILDTYVPKSEAEQAHLDTLNTAWQQVQS